MSQQQNYMMDQDTAFALVHEQVYAPVFFTKLANDYGIQPRNAQEAEAMLRMASQLRDAHEAELTKEASDQTDFVRFAQAHLENALYSQGYEVSDVNEHQIYKVASDVAQDPDIARAVLSLQAAAAAAQAE